MLLRLACVRKVRERQKDSRGSEQITNDNYPGDEKVKENFPQDFHGSILFPGNLPRGRCFAYGTLVQYRATDVASLNHYNVTTMETLPNVRFIESRPASGVR